MASGRLDISRRLRLTPTALVHRFIQINNAEMISKKIPCIFATLTVLLAITERPYSVMAFPSVAPAAVVKATSSLPSLLSPSDKLHPKRSVSYSAFGDSGYPWAVIAGAKQLSGFRYGGTFDGASNGAWNPWNSFSTRILDAHSPSPSPTEVANLIASAKQASANVLITQHQMQAAKDQLLNAQRTAMEKETAAAILTQKSEAAAAIQRSEAAAAAQAVVLAQQRLAASKATVAQHQRIAAAREAEAATALQKSAHAAAVEIQKSEDESSKFGQFARNGNAIAAHQLTLAKDTAVLPISAGTNHVGGLALFPHDARPWPTSMSHGSPPAPAPGKFNEGAAALGDWL